MLSKRSIFLSTCFTLFSLSGYADLEEFREDQEEDLIDQDIAYEDEIADAPMYAVISQECLDKTPAPQKLHHYVLYGEMLYVKPYMGGMPWTYLQDNSQLFNPNSSSTTYSAISEDIKNITMDFDFGFRIGVGFNTTWMKLENQLTWMRLHTQTSHELSTLTNIVNTVDPAYAFGQPLIYSPFWFSLSDSALSTGASVPGIEIGASETTKLKWDQIDWVFKIPLTPMKKLAFLPLLGIRGLISTVSSKQSQFFAAYGDTFTTTPPFNNTVTQLKERFNAVGLVAGMESDIHFGWGIHLSALLDASIVYGNVKRNHHTVINVPVVPGKLVPQDYYAYDQNSKFKPIFDGQATLSWNWNFCKSKYTLNTHIGYEVHYMPDFLEFIRVINDGDTPYTYDLMMQGFNAGLGLSF